VRALAADRRGAQGPRPTAATDTGGETARRVCQSRLERFIIISIIIIIVVVVAVIVVIVISSRINNIDGFTLSRGCMLK